MNGQCEPYVNGRKPRVHRRKRRSILGWTVVIFVCIMVAVLVAFPQTGIMSGEMLISSGADEMGTIDRGAGQDQALPENHGQQSDSGDWKLILVNKWNPLPEKYDVILTELSNGQSVDLRIYEALQAMFDAARAEGVYPVVAAGYRTAEKQQSLMDEKVADLIADGYSETEAKSEAEKWVAVPGTSEHELGLAVDINADGINSAGYEVYDWLAENAYTYGFICRYPDGKTDITGVYNEPWHYRYVGVEAAAAIKESGLCLEEYLENT